MSQRLPKVALYGNIANNFYVIAKTLRRHSDLDVHLYLEDNLDIVQSPESEDPELANNYPEWIHRSKDWNIKSIFFFWKRNLVKEFAHYDVVVLSGRGVMLSPFIRAKTIFFVTGGDLTLSPFYKRWRLIYPTGLLKSIIEQTLQRMGIRSMKEIWTQPFFPFVDALKRLRVKEACIKDRYFPVIVDNHLFNFDSNAHLSSDKNIRFIVDNFNFMLFHPSRIMINDHDELKRAGQWKQNDLLFYAFADLVNTYGARDVVLVMPDRNLSPDIVKAKQIIKQLGIEKNVLWIKAENQEGFTRRELVKFYSIADAVADDFGVGWFGSVVLEGLAVGKPVLSYVDESVMKKLYPWHPLLSSNTREGLLTILIKLYEDKEYRKQQGGLGRVWIEEFHSQESASKVYVQQFVNGLTS